MSGGTDLTNNVGLVFVVSFYGERTHLDVAVLLRKVDSQRLSLEQLSPLPPPGAGPGGGASCGNYVFFFELETRTLWLDSKPWVPLGDENLLLCDATDVGSNVPLLVGKLHLEHDLGPSPTFVNVQDRLLLNQALIEELTGRLEKLPAVLAFVRL